MRIMKRQLTSRQRKGTFMRFAIASDIHGSAKWCEKFLKAADEERATRLFCSATFCITDHETKSPRATTPKALRHDSMSAQVPLWPHAAIAMRKSTK